MAEMAGPGTDYLESSARINLHTSLRYDSPLCIPLLALKESAGHTRALYFIRRKSKMDEGCSDTRLAAEPVPRVNGDRLMMPLAHIEVSLPWARIWLCRHQVAIGRLSTSCRHELIAIILE